MLQVFSSVVWAKVYNSGFHFTPLFKHNIISFIIRVVSSFQGEIQELLLTNNPSDAARQCETRVDDKKVSVYKVPQ